MILICVTCKDEKEAEKISKKLLEKRYVACANMFPIKSLYWWKSKINQEREFILILKTLNKNFALVKREIEKLHSYKIPCIEKINIETNKKCEEWLNKTVR